VSLSDLKAEYEAHYMRAQQILREYVVSKQYPIDDRFEVWSEWCMKEKYPWVIDESDVPFFGKIVRDDENDVEFYHREEYDWLFFLELFDGTNEGADMRERYTVTYDDVKELLIKHNFGDYRHDW
jgi:hypothetical protein